MFAARSPDSSTKRAKIETKAKRMFGLSSKPLGSSADMLASQPRRGSKPRPNGLFRRRPPRMTTTELLAVHQTISSKEDTAGVPGYVALCIATMILAMLLSLIFIAAFMFLPIHVFLLQGTAVQLAMVIAMYFLLRIIEQSWFRTVEG